MTKTTTLKIEAWPQLIEALQKEVGWLGNDPSDVAKFLLIESLEHRRCQRNDCRRAEWLAETARLNRR